MKLKENFPQIISMYQKSDIISRYYAQAPEEPPEDPEPVPLAEPEPEKRDVPPPEPVEPDEPWPRQ